MATEAGVAYVTILPSMRGFAPALNSGIQKDVGSAGQSAGSNFGARMVGALGTAVKGASIGATIFGGLALKSGLNRLTTIQNATQSLTTILGDAGAAAKLMGEIKKTVNGTPFNLDQFADAGKNLAAMNIPAAKVPGILTAIGNAAATSGKGAEGVASLVDTFGKMAAQGQVSLDQVWSISSTGVPALQILANGFGETTTGMKKLISDGAVPANKAIDILTKGIQDGSKGAAGSTIAFGGAMQGLRQTFTGAFGGMKAAVARFGAAALSPFLGLMTAGATGTGAFLDKIAKKVTPVMQTAANAVGSLISGLTGAKFAGVGKPLDAWVAKGEAVRAMLGRIRDGASGLYAFVTKGDFTGAFSRAFGVDEDSPVVDYMFKIRDAVVQVVAQFKQVDLSSVQSALSGTGTAFASIGGVFSTVRDNMAVLKPAISDVGTAMAGLAGGSGVILSNLLHILSGTVQFFADHTTIATAAILALTGAMAASGPISQAYKLAYIIRTPLMVAQTIQAYVQAGATTALTAAINANTIANGGNAAVAKQRLGVMIATKTWSLITAAATAVWSAATTVATAVGIAWLTVQEQGLLAATRMGAALVWQKAVMIASATWTGIVTAAQWAWNAAMSANPLLLIIIGIAALVAGLVLFFTKTETGRKIITAVWGAIKTAIGAVVDWFTQTAWPALKRAWDAIATAALWLWNDVLKPAWDAIATAAKWLWGTIFKPVFTAVAAAFAVVGDVVMGVWNGFLSPVFQLIGAIVSWLWTSIFSVVIGAIVTGWKVLAAVFTWAWSVIGPVFQLIGAIASWLWDSVLSGVITFIKVEWAAMAAIFTWAWGNVLKPVFNAIGAAASWLWNTVLSPVIGWIKARWSDLMLGMQTLWATVLKPALSAIGAAFQWVWNTIISPVIGFIKTAWDGLMTGIKAVWESVLKPVFNAISTAVGAVKTAFENVVAGIKTVWDGLIEVAKAPVKFVVNTIINDVFIKGFNKLAGIFGTDPISPIELPKGFARGGPVRGPGTGTSDSIPAMLSDGEHVTREKQARKYPGLLTAINSGAYRGPDMPQYLAGGGFVESMMNTVKAKFPQAVLNSGLRPGDPGYHGRGQAADLGWSARPGGAGNAYLAAMNTWLYDTYGKGTAELIYDGLGDNRPDIKNGSAHTYSPGTQAQHHNHVHWALDSLDVLKGAGGAASGSGGGSGGSSVLDFLGGLNPIKWLTDKVSGLFGKAGNSGFAKFATGLPKKLLSLVAGKFTGLFDASGTASSGTGIDQWITQAISPNRTGVGAGWIPGLHTLIMRESGGNARAVNNTDSNAAAGHPSKGLMQLIDTTFSAYRDKTLVNDVFDPLANIVAGINYIKARYGGIENVQQADPNKPAKGYDSGGFLMPGVQSVFNATGRPEPVLTTQQWQTAARGIELATRIASSSTGMADGGSLLEEVAGLRNDLEAHGKYVAAVIADRNDEAVNRTISDNRRRVGAGTSRVTT